MRCSELAPRVTLAAADHPAAFPQPGRRAPQSLSLGTLAKKYLALRVPLRHTWTVLYDWDSKKNDFLKANRGISFEAVIVHLGRGDIWKVTDHPDQLRHPGQSILFVIVDDYVHMVPFEIRGDTLWLVTVIPSRKATREYRKEKQNETEQRRKGN